jgi:hypothetical protein
MDREPPASGHAFLVSDGSGGYCTNALGHWRATMRHPIAILSLSVVTTLAACSAPDKRVVCQSAAPEECLGVSTPAVSTKSLLHQMVDLSELAEFPDPPYVSAQFSSYDRAAKSPEDNWFANDDRGQYLRTEECDDRTEYVMLDVDGPGAVVRIWSANPEGVLRIYLDENPRPVLEVLLRDLLSGKVASIPEPLSGEASSGFNCYFPFPYARHCKLTTDRGEGLYYHIDYRTYAPLTRVVSFTPCDLETLKVNIQLLAAQLSSPRAAGSSSEVLCGRDVHTSRKHTRLAPGCAKRLALKGQGCGRAVYAFHAKVDSGDLEQSLRDLVLSVTFDGTRTVLCPLGDFFGAAPGVNPYESLALGVDCSGQMWSHWVMPFQRSAVFEVRNLGACPARLDLAVVSGPYEWTERSMYFHCQWHAARDIPTRPMQDWNYVTISGKGVFVGAAFNICNPVKQWWGEGDEKIYVDGEGFPSIFGTGTEDYYGYAWGSAVPFAHAYHCQPCCGSPGNYGNTAVNRWHILDRLPFQNCFRFDMELWHWWEGVIPGMSVATYWYGRPGATGNPMAITPDLLKVCRMPAYTPECVPGAQECEDLRIVASTGNPAPQEIDGCSNDRHLWWSGGKLGDRLVLAFDAPEACRYRVLVCGLQAPDYAVAQFYINDELVGDPVDFYNQSLKVGPEVLLGAFDLCQGTNLLGIELVGANEAALRSYMAGLDYIRLEPVH